jgi:hypothetical protein
VILALVRVSHDVRQQRGSWHVLEVVVFEDAETHFPSKTRSVVQCQYKKLNA